MNIKSKTDSARMLVSYFSRSGTVQRVLSYEGVTADVKKRALSALFSPESQGIPSEYLTRFYTEIENKKGLNIQTVTVARNGKTVSVAEFYPYKRGVLSETHSFSKSVVSLAVGIAIDEGAFTLDTTLGEIFSDEINELGTTAASKLKIRQLLTMSTGIQFNELGSVTEKNWIRAYLSSSLKHRPGTVFDYNSMNSYMLSAAVVRKMGLPLSEFLKEKLFTPLGITEFYWEKSPEGIEKGGWGLYLLCDDAVKFGQLIAQNGTFNEKRIVSEKWIREATRCQMKTPPITGVYDYGYHMWVDEDEGELLFNGMFGRNLHIFTKTKTVIYTACMNGDLFQRCELYQIIKKYFGKKFIPSGTLEENSAALQRLREKEQRLSCANSLCRRYISGVLRSDGLCLLEGHKVRVFEFDLKQTQGISVLPTMVQAIHNNFRKGIKKLEFVFGDDSVIITVCEADCEYTFKAGYFKAEESVIKIGSDEYRIASLGEFTRTEDDIPVLKLNVSFLQLSNSRYFKMYFEQDGLRVLCDETPGADFVSDSLGMIVGDSLNPKLVEKTKKTLNSRLFQSKLKHFLQPEFKSK